MSYGGGICYTYSHQTSMYSSDSVLGLHCANLGSASYAQKS